MKPICILGGYGVFGSLIARGLAREALPIMIAGRNTHKAQKLAVKLRQKYPHSDVETALVNLKRGLKEQLLDLKPSIVINTCGPFQQSDYSIAEACIELGIHYIDLADGRDYVTHFSSLDENAKQHQVMAITGASTVPGLSSAVIECFQNEFKTIDELAYGITPGGKTPRGLATTKSILTYLGKPLKDFPGGEKIYGWQNLHAIRYPELGIRLMGNCDIPDLDFFPEKYHIKSIRFSAGMESKALHMGIWLLSWLVRAKLPLKLINYAAPLLRMSHFFDKSCSEDGGMHVILKGIDHQDKPLTIKWFLVVKEGDGPNVPTIPAIILARRIFEQKMHKPGAYPCAGLITLEDYLKELNRFASRDYVHRIT